jgi:disulfide bond formation protein DsbB
MSSKAKWILVGVLVAVALGFLQHHYKPCALEMLQRFIAVGFCGVEAVVAAAF